MLAAPILALGLPTLIILNMADDLRNRGGKLDVPQLSPELGAPVALISARAGEGIEQVFDFLAGAMPKPAARHCCRSCRTCRSAAPGPAQVGSKAGYRAADPAHMDAPPGLRFPASGRRAAGLSFWSWSAVFQTIFMRRRSLNERASTGFIQRLRQLARRRAARHPRSARSLIDGVWKGVGSVVVFLPQILLLFLFIGILEDSGYLARAALIADRTMARVGLQGKVFIPLLSAYACAVPAIMATRTIENKRDRIATILIAPFMTCSARLPVYALMIAAFIPEQARARRVPQRAHRGDARLYVLGFAGGGRHRAGAEIVAS